MNTLQGTLVGAGKALTGAKRWLLTARGGLLSVVSRVGAAVMSVVGIALVGLALTGMAGAYANAANPLPTTTGTAVVHADGSVTVTLNGTWIWPQNGPQPCSGRYGEGWAIDWWGVSTSPTPSNPFTLTDATEVTSSSQTSVPPPGTVATGSVSPVGAIEYKPGGTYFHVGQYYSGSDVNTPTTCTDTTPPGGKETSTGPWYAQATYPSTSDVPADLCIILYDEHGSEGKVSGSASDFSPINDHDNSIDTNVFNPAAGAGYCFSSSFVPSVSVAKSGPATGTVGGNGTYQLVATNSGNAPADNVVITDTLPTGETYVSSNDPNGTCTLSGTPVSGTSPGTGQTISCPVGTVGPSGGTATVTVTVSYGSGTANQTLVDCATVAGQPVPACASTHIPGTPGVSVVKSGPATGTAGGNGTYQLVATNTGTADAPDVVITDTLPTGETYVSSSDPNGTCTLSGTPVSGTSPGTGQTISCPVGTLSAGGGTATVSVTVSYGSGTGGQTLVDCATVSGQPVPSCVPTVIGQQGITGHIYLCSSGSQTTNEVPGGTLSATGPQTIASTANPLSNSNVAAGTYTMSAGAPSGYDFTSCGGSATIGSPPTSATESVNVPTNGTGNGVFYVTPITQAIIGHIYSCSGGSQTTTEVPGGTLSASGPQTIAATANPLSNSSVAAGNYTMTAGAPSGYEFTSCGGTATIGSNGSSATEPVTVPSGGTGTGVFYVMPIPSPPAITLGITKANDANGSGTYAQTETATAAGENVPFQVVVTNTSSVPVTITNLTDSWPSQSPFSPNCASAVVGTTLQPGASATCDFTVDNYAPPAGSALTNTATVTGCQSASSSNCISVPATSTVNTPPPVTPGTPATITVTKANDANGSGTYAQSETATAAGENVPFQVVVTNTSTIPVTITNLSDSWPSQAPFSPTCSSAIVGQTLQPGASATCDFTVDNYAPPAGSTLTNTATVTACPVGASSTSSLCSTQPATSTVNTPAAPPPTSPATKAASSQLAFTGAPAHLQLLLELGFAMTSAGFFVIWFTRPRRKALARNR